MSGPEDEPGPLSGWFGSETSDDDHPFSTTEEKRYGLGNLLGWGGMGTVHAVEDRRLRREVAWKQGSDARLPQEAWITANLEHPGIVPVYDAGQDDQGRPFYTMRLIRGQTLAEALQQTRNLRERLRLLRHFLDTCQAMAYAHHVGVVHRDLKPSNIMVGEFGETQVVDWGVAKPLERLHETEDEDSVIPAEHYAMTLAGAVVGTPAYMSPEQARGEPPDPRSDIWSLGVILYEIIDGHPPFTEQTSDEVLYSVLNRDIPPLTADAPPDLIAIAYRALSKDPHQRYTDADAMANDVEAWLDGRQVFAHDYSPLELLLRFVHAWRVPLTAAALTTLVIGAAIASATVRINRARVAAEQAQLETSRALDAVDQQLAHSIAARSIDAFQKGITSEAELLAAKALTMHESPNARGVLAGVASTQLKRISIRPAPCDDGSLSESGRLFTCVEDGKLTVWDTDTNELHLSVPGQYRDHFVHEDNRRLVLVGHGQTTIQILDLDTGASITKFETPEFWGIGPSRFGTSAFLAQHALILLDSTDGQYRTLPACTDSATGYAAIHGERQFVICIDESLEYFQNGKLTRTLLTPERAQVRTTAVELTASGEVLLAKEGALQALDLETMKPTWDFQGQQGRIGTIATHGDMITYSGDQLAPVVISHRNAIRLPLGIRQVRLRDGAITTSGANGIERWTLDTGPLDRFWHSAGIAAIHLSSSGELLSVGDGNGWVHVWSMDGHSQAKLKWQNLVVKDVSFSHDSAYLAAVAMGPPRAILYETQTWTPKWPPINNFSRRIEPVGDQDFFLGGWSHRHPTLSPDGDQIDRLENTYVQETDSSSTAVAVLTPTGDPSKPAERGGVWILEDEDRHFIPVQDGGSVALAEDGRIAVLFYNHVSILDREGAILTQLDTTRRVLDMDWSPDGRWLALGSLDGSTEVWNVEEATLRAVLHGHDERVVSLQFSPDGSRLYTGSWDGTVRGWVMRALWAEPESWLLDAETRLGRHSEHAVDMVF